MDTPMEKSRRDFLCRHCSALVQSPKAGSLLARTKVCSDCMRAKVLTSADGSALRFCHAHHKLEPLYLFTGDNSRCDVALEKLKRTRFAARLNQARQQLQQAVAVPKSDHWSEEYRRHLESTRVAWSKISLAARGISATEAMETGDSCDASLSDCSKVSTNQVYPRESHACISFKSPPVLSEELRRTQTQEMHLRSQNPHLWSKATTSTTSTTSEADGFEYSSLNVPIFPTLGFGEGTTWTRPSPDHGWEIFDTI